MLAPDEYDDPFAELAEGRVPSLAALRLHTGTVWRWNRGCYGITDGVPHLRIENRVLPSGPSVVDEIANAALWLGLMRAVGTRHPEVNRMMPFEQARANFVAAARQGLASHQTWLDGEEHTATSARPRRPAAAGRRRARRSRASTAPTATATSASSSGGSGRAHGVALDAQLAQRRCATRAPPGSGSTA